MPYWNVRYSLYIPARDWRYGFIRETNFFSNTILRAPKKWKPVHWVFSFIVTPVHTPKRKLFQSRLIASNGMNTIYRVSTDTVPFTSKKCEFDKWNIISSVPDVEYGTRHGTIHPLYVSRYWYTYTKISRRTYTQPWNRGTWWWISFCALFLFRELVHESIVGTPNGSGCTITLHTDTGTRHRVFTCRSQVYVQISTTCHGWQRYWFLVGQSVGDKFWTSIWAIVV